MKTWLKICYILFGAMGVLGCLVFLAIAIGTGSFTQGIFVPSLFGIILGLVFGGGYLAFGFNFLPINRFSNTSIFLNLAAIAFSLLESFITQMGSIIRIDPILLFQFLSLFSGVVGFALFISLGSLIMGMSRGIYQKIKGEGNYRTNKTYIIITFLPIIIIVICFVVYVKYQIIGTPGSSVKRNDSLQGSMSLQTYTNTAYGFSLTYPVDFVNVNDLTVMQQESLVTYMGICPVGNNSRIQPNETGFCYIGNQTSDGFVAASLNITPSASINMQDCEKVEQSGSQGGQMSLTTQQTIINNIIFYHTQISDAGLGHYMLVNSYRTYHEGVCYTVDLNIESDRGVSEKGLSVDFSSMMQSKLDSMLSTFKFTN